jgi:hypothetical protein
VIDAAISAYPGIEAHLRQRRDEAIEWDPAIERLLALGRSI